MATCSLPTGVEAAAALCTGGQLDARDVHGFSQTGTCKYVGVDVPVAPLSCHSRDSGCVNVGCRLSGLLVKNPRSDAQAC